MWSGNPRALKNYSSKNELNYTLLIGKNEVAKEYKTGGSVPVFFHCRPTSGDPKDRKGIQRKGE